MKRSLRKLGVPAVEKHKRDWQLEEELTQATQDMQDTRDCYDTLLSAAAAVANSAYEFSESLGDLGSCLLEKTALNDDEESGNVLLMLGKMQFQLHKLIDYYVTVLVPSLKSLTIPSIVCVLLNFCFAISALSYNPDHYHSIKFSSE